MLLEKISLHGICRAVGVSIQWLIDFMVECFEAAPDRLHMRLPSRPGNFIIRDLEAEAGEMHSFVKKKADVQWIWLAIDQVTQHVIAFRVGDRSRQSARQLWKKLPAVYREQATFYTDQ